MDILQTSSLFAVSTTGTGVVQTVMVFVAAGLAAGGLAAGFYGARQKGIIELLKTENGAYKDSNLRLHEDNAALKQELAQTGAEAKMWRDNVTQSPSIEKLIESTNKQHGQYMVEMGKITKGLTDLTAAITSTVKRGGS